MFVTKTRRKTMHYNKPELVTLPSSIRAVQGVHKGGRAFLDTDKDDPLYPLPFTILVYEADE